MNINMIQHNIQAMFTDRQLGITVKSKAKSAEKLSSGFKINRAADDAAGLAISEKMRHQIRGLNQGSDNIQDGISLIQVADGALEEVTNCLQRINELSIKAYNGTNSKSDREDIQKEVNQLLIEIERIADTTKLNETKVLKQKRQGDVKVSDFWQEISYHEEFNVTREVPDWLKVSKKLTKDNSANLSSMGINVGQDTGLYGFYMADFSPYDPVHDAYVMGADSKYWGPSEVPADDPYIEVDGIRYDVSAAQYKGEWSQEMDDNPSAVIDFSGLSGVKDISELYTKTMELIGCSIGVNCATCSDFYGISFIGNEKTFAVSSLNDMVYEHGGRVSQSVINLSEWKAFPDPENMTIYEKIEDVMIKFDKSGTPAGERAAQTQKLADEIAKKLRNKSYEELKKTCDEKNHYNRVLDINAAGYDNDYALVIYDYRDDDDSGNGAYVYDDTKDVMTKCITKAKVADITDHASKTRRGLVGDPIMIQGSANAQDRLTVVLPGIDLKEMGIVGYNVARYTSYVESNGTYEQRLSNWEKNATIKKTYIPEEIIPAYTEVVQKNNGYDKITQGMKAVNGEVHYASVHEYVPPTKYWTETINHPQQIIPAHIESEKVYHGPKPKPNAYDYRTVEEYAPDDVALIGDAIKYVSKWRSILGAEQNRLEHAYNQNQNTAENTTASESRIRDTDMAEETVKNSNASIIQQAGESMLAQANQSKQGIMTLLG